MGLHIHYPADLEGVRALARAGKLAGLTIIDDTGFANEMVSLVPFVVLRKYGVEHQGYVPYGADPRVICQMDNEQLQPHDTGYYLDMMKAADADGRKVVIFNDPVGTPEDNVWLDRRPALEYCAQHKHFIGLHAYGITTDGGPIYHPMTEQSGWRWFAGRFLHLYGLIPDLAPNLILTECGAGGAQRNAGNAETWLKDVQAMDEIAQRYPFLQAFNWWTVGGRGPLGFEEDHLDDWIHVL